MGERAEFFLWYHYRATGEVETEMEVIAAYLKESGTPVPGLYDLYEEMAGVNRPALRAPVPGRVRLKENSWLDQSFGADVFEAKGLAPFYVFRDSNGQLVRVSSKTDSVLYWPKRSAIVAWLTFLIGILSLVLAILVMFP